MWLGGLFVPEAFITASRQYVAQAHNHSLEELSLRVRIMDGSASVTLDDKTFAISGHSLLKVVIFEIKCALTSMINDF